MQFTPSAKHSFRYGYLILLAFVITKMILQYVTVHPVYELQRDEYLHLDQAQHLAWGYQSVPPVTSWISWIIMKLGNGVFWVKFFPAVFGALTIVVVWKAVQHLGGSLFAAILAATGLLCSVLLRINMLYQPNSLDILCWTLVYYTLLRYFQTSNNRYLYLMAVSVAIGFLNKYNIAFCIVGLLPALALSKYRSIFTNRHLYYAIGLTLVLISGNLIWQYQNNFPVLWHMKELAETQLVHVNRADFLKEQIFFFIGSLSILVAAFISFFRYTPFYSYRLYFWAYLFTMGMFIYLKAKAYYAIGLYPIFFAFGSCYLAHLLVGRWLYFLRFVSIAIILFFFYALLEFAMPLYPPEKYAADAAQHLPFSSHTWEDGKKYPISQDFADMLGWKELTHKVDSLYETLSPQDNILVLCDNYGQTSAINYYTRHKTLRADAFIPDYVHWVNLDRTIDHVIRVKNKRNTDLTRDHSLFNTVSTIDSIVHPYSREHGTRILLLAQPKLDLAELLRNERVKGTIR